MPAPIVSHHPLDTAPDWFKSALLEIGTRELPDNSGPAIQRYIELAKAGHQGDPWCAIFANAMLEMNGVPGTKSAASQSFRDHHDFSAIQSPALGAVAVFWRKSKTSGLGHVGFYRGERSGRVYVLGGNESDQVAVQAYPKDSPSFGLVGYYWPASVIRPAIGPIAFGGGEPLPPIQVV